jgi:hypothetical protein
LIIAPVAEHLKPRWARPVYSGSAATPSFSLFFNGAAPARLSNCLLAAPLKDKVTVHVNDRIMAEQNHKKEAMTQN